MKITQNEDKASDLGIKMAFNTLVETESFQQNKAKIFCESFNSGYLAACSEQANTHAHEE